MDTSLRTNGINKMALAIEVCSALTLVVILAALSVYERKKTKADLYFKGILLDVICALFADVMAVYFRGDMSQAGYYIVRISNFISFLANNLAIWFVIQYAVERIRQEQGAPKKIYEILNHVFAAGCIVMMTWNLFAGQIYFIDEQNIYHRGNLLWITHVPLIFSVALLIVLLVRYRKNLTKTVVAMILTFVLLPVLAEVVQFYVYGFPWVQVAMAFACFLALTEYLLIQKNYSAGKEERLNQEGKALQKRIILFVCVIIIVFFGFIAKIATGFASRQMNQEIQAHYQMLANKTTEQVSAWIVRQTQIVLNQKASLEIMNNFDPEYLTEYLTSIVEDYNYDGYIYDLYFVNTDNVMSSGCGYIPDPSIDFTQRDWYVGALSADNMCYTVPYMDTNLHQYVVTVSIKVFDKTRRFRGVLALDIFVDKVFGITAHQELPKNSYLFIVDDEMGLVTHPNPDFGYRNEQPQKMTELLVKEYGRLARFLQVEHQQMTYETLTDYDGMKRCFFFSQVEDCDWYVVAAISKNVMDDAQLVLSEGIFISLIICLVLGIILTLWMTNNIIRKLTEAREASYAANEAKSRFLANMSHEIRTPINAVLGMDEILLRECKDESIREYALNIQSAGQALLGVINDILDFSKIESDKLDIVPTDYSLGGLMGSCINLVRLRMESKGLLFYVERDEYLPKVLYGDEIRVRQVISNLLTNAAKYTREGSVTLTVKWRETAEKEGVLQISVKDTGIGIKPESLPDLFSSFQRLDERKNRNIEGTGLGLTITKQLVELMGGTITVESEYGNGSEFLISIPQKVVDAAVCGDFEAAIKENENHRQLQFTAETAKILVVDDVNMNLQVVRGLLKNTGIEIDTAESGRRAIAMIAANDYDMIFLDHMMPEMDGVETLRYLKANYAARLGETPVIMLTANAVLGVEEEYKKEGFYGYLSKPVNQDALYECLFIHLPKEKIKEEEQALQEEDQADNGQAVTPLQYIKTHCSEFDEQTALTYCGGMEEMLVEMLKEYAGSDLKDRIQNAFEQKDWEAYQISVHALKSVSLTLGFKALSEDAKELELAAKENRIEDILSKHEAVYDRYLNILACIKKSGILEG